MPIRIKSIDITVQDVVNLIEYMNALGVSYDLIIETKTNILECERRTGKK
jgi:hypothetical protein